MADGQRRVLQDLAPPDRSGGEAEDAAVLRRALQLAAEGPDDSLTHGFHAYPARMHPAVARTVLAAWGSPPRGRVLDPFCGSGTVLVESMVVGLHATGVDLSPLAIRLCETKCSLRSAATRERFVERLEAVCEASKARVRGRVRVRAPLSAAERQWYAPHVLLELGGLHAEIEQVRPKTDRRALQVLLSAIVVKFSRQRADTQQEATEKRIGKLVVTDFFRRKGLELVDRWAALSEACPDGRVPTLHEGDATDLGAVLGRARFDLVLSSPPYGGTYDYAEHHARRLPWLGLRAKRLRDAEIGARRDLASRSTRDAAQQWDGQVHAMLSSIASVLAKDGRCVLLIGDGEVGGRQVAADAQIRRIAPEVGLHLAAWAGAPRPDRRGGRPRIEHVLLLRPRSARR